MVKRVAKYLGVTIGRKIHFNTHVKNIVKKATQVRCILIPHLKQKKPDSQANQNPDAQNIH